DDVDREDLLEPAEIVRHLLAEGALGERDAGAVDQHVQAAEFLQRERDCGLAVGLGGDVALDEAADKLARQLLARLGLEIGARVGLADRQAESCGKLARELYGRFIKN